MKRVLAHDEVMGAMMSMAPTPVYYIKKTELDYRRCSPRIQVVDLRRR